MSGTLFIVSAASGTGKTSLVKWLLSEEPRVFPSVSYTTRAPRAGEIDGKDYHFVSVAEFEAMSAAGDFLEQALIYGNRYGTSRQVVEAQLNQGDVLLEIDWQGAKQVLSNNVSRVNVVTIFILPPSLTELERRLRTRALDDEAAVQRRLSMAKTEILHAASYQFVIINQDFDEACLDFRSVVRIERLKLAHHRKIWNHLILE